MSRPFAGCSSVRSPRSFLVVGLLAAGVHAQAPAGYYSAVDTTNADTLRATLHEVIDDHTRFPYTSPATDTWDILEMAQEDPSDPSRIIDVYRNSSFAKEGGGNSFYNREHTWPTSYGFPNDNSSNYPYTDCHMLFLCDDGYNSSRSNKPYRSCSAACSELTTDLNNGSGGGAGVYPGSSNWTSGSLTAGTWETWIGRRGDVARALLYADVRYEGGQHGVTDVIEPDLVLTDDEALIAGSNTASNEAMAYMGMLSVLLAWHQQDPVDAEELARNEVVFAFQGNRNPFVDHPEWVDCVFSSSCSVEDTTPPLPPVGLSAVGGNGRVDLDWGDNVELDLAGYHVYRSLDAVAYVLVDSGLAPTSSYSDVAVTNGVTYFYTVTAVDTSGNESAMSGAASATPSGPPAEVDPWINEFHYDNSGSDTLEFVEIAGPAGTDLSGWRVIGYNGNGGGMYKTVNLSGSLPAQEASTGTLGFAFTSMQNGAPDGLALVDPADLVVQFLSYEGSFVATDGPADGMSSSDVGVRETNSTAVGFSLQLTGSGSSYADFLWADPIAGTQGQPNSGQEFTGGAPDTTPPAPPSGLAALAGEGQVELDWFDSTEPDLASYDLMRATSSGGPYSQVNGVPLTESRYTDTAVANGSTYYYVVTASDDAGNESLPSGEASATPADVTAPAPPAGLVASPADGSITLDWSDNTEPDLAGYEVRRSTTSGGAYTSVGTPAASVFIDMTVTNAQTYYYVVRALDEAGNASTDSTEVSATPQAAMPPVASFSGIPTSGIAPLSVSFTDSSTNAPSSWIWSFGDGGSSSQENPQHTYVLPGTYTVALTVTNADGGDTLVRPSYVTVAAPPAPPVADFTGSPVSGVVPLTVSFTDASTNEPTSWAWDFGDGGTSSLPDPAHTYHQAGTYTVSLAVANSDGSDTLVRSGYVTASEPPSSGSLFYLSFLANTSVPGVGTVADEDVVSYSPSTGTWALYFDGSDMGVGGGDVDALHVRSDGNLLLSFNNAISVPGLLGGPDGEDIDDSDIVLFTFTSSGASTTGTFSFYFDGSDVGLTTNGEDIDGLAELSGGLAFTTSGTVSVSGQRKRRDEDVLLFFDSQLGSTTAGTFQWHFDGSDVGFATSSGEDLGALSFDGADLLFCTRGDWEASGGAGADEDIGRFAGSFGPSTSGSASQELDLSSLGIATGAEVDGLSYVP